MKPRVLFLVLALASVGVVPLAAGAQVTCVTDDSGDAPAGYDIVEMCVSAGGEDPVELVFGIVEPAADLTLSWQTEGWAVATDGTTTTVTIDGQAVECDAATSSRSDSELFQSFVPARCLPDGPADVIGASTDAEGAPLDTTAVAMTEVPASGGGGGAGPGDGFTRLAGASRIETAVAISRDSYPSGAAAVLLADAGNPVDALPASRSAYSGPILYVPSCGDLPQVVADEIARLQPTDIIVLGGTGAICDDMGDQAVAAR